MKTSNFPFDIKVNQHRWFEMEDRPAALLTAPVALSDDEVQQLQELVRRNGGERNASRLRLLQAAPLLYRKIEQAVRQACERLCYDNALIDEFEEAQIFYDNEAEMMARFEADGLFDPDEPQGGETKQDNFGIWLEEYFFDLEFDQMVEFIKKYYGYTAQRLTKEKLAFEFSFSIPEDVLSARTSTPLSSYYDVLFQEDLRYYFLFEEKDGLLFMRERGKIPAAADHAAQRRPRTDEEKMYFIALISFIFAAEKALLYLANWHADEQALARMMNDFGLPWISTSHEYELEGFIAATKLDARIRSLHDAEVLRDAGLQVEPFMLNKLLPFIRTWDNCSLYRSNHSIEFIGAYVGDSLSKLFRDYYHRYFQYQGLLGLDGSDVCITDEALSSYYPKRFFQNFQSYFTSVQQENGYRRVMGISLHENRRWEDGNPGGNASDNLMFSCILLYMYTAQQSILRKAGEETETLFYQYSGWPMIFAGKGDQYLNPLVLIEEAGLHPTKQESGQYHDAARSVFSFFRREFDALLDGRHPATKHEPFAQQFLTAIQEGEPSAKSKILDYMDQEEDRLLSLILKWGSFPADHFCLLLSEEGILTNDYSN